MKGISDVFYSYLYMLYKEKDKKESLFQWAKGTNENLNPTDEELEQHLNDIDEEGKTLLHHTALKCDREKFHRLISIGANIHATDSSGKNVAHLIFSPSLVSPSFSEHAIILKLITQAFVNLNLKSKEKKTPLDNALECYHLDNRYCFASSELMGEGARFDYYLKKTKS